ncbi:cellulose binding domain-containing protein [Streptomyces sp. TRM66268-LWL]|uniref:Cellulose binding domain-containing protein n=1 Tax=Streptomyces polyasparticus TaxID=2767826 RepID=A0ABR7SNF6_9ACTN|nr:cellulose binding domain-containing protein [Streptomyces polyasparticus]MBC9717020.1 cellulose binding domain-containing protein [Streptomyces polyasparticus]
MSSSRNAHRRTLGGKAKAIGAVVAAAAVGTTVMVFTGTAQAAGAGAAYTKTSSWSGGYTAQYVITNDSDKPLGDWTLEFDLPAGTELSSLWNGDHTVEGGHVTVRPAAWDTDLAPGKTVTVGFVASGKGADPSSCTIDGADCSTAAEPAPGTEAPTSTAAPTDEPTSQPTSTPSSGPTSQPSGTATTDPAEPTAPAGSTTRFAPFVDTSLAPAYDLVGTADKTGVKEFNLAFVTAGNGGCTPLWGGSTGLGDDKVASQIGALRAKGGDVRVSFGGAAGSELALNCGSADDLAAAYGKVVDAYKLTKVDFDIEGAALPDTAANTRRAQAIAQLQKQHPGLDVSFTLPVMPEGLTQPGVDLLMDAKKNGVTIDNVNIMAMDYGPSYSGDMGTYAEQAATATQAQIKGVLGLSDSAAWQAVAVTPMIGVNDVTTEIFKVDDAAQLVKFAEAKGMGWLSMWSSTRDKACEGGSTSVSPTCSSISQEPLAFTKAFAAYK